MRALVLALTFGSLTAAAQEPAAAPAPVATEAATPTTPPNTPAPVLRGGCVTEDARGLPEGPIAMGYVESDLASGRRACPRNELGLGVRGLGIIDTPNFYGNVGAQGLLFGSWAVRPTTELFAQLEAISFGFTQNATLTTTQLTLGHMTAGVSQVLYDTEKLSGALTGRVLLPSSFEIPGMRLVGAEVGHSVSWRPKSWLEVHGAASVDLTLGVGSARPDPRVGGFALIGAMWQPTTWFGLVLDVNGRVGRVSYLAPSVGLRFRVAALGIEVGGSLPVVGNDRHDFVAGLRLSWRL
ncbi:MAG: hypothetical protein JNJ54_34395 [Myxococcaceae bacterium]|nr:hypothetical protein [Myxococcaceae bacterium]